MQDNLSRTISSLPQTKSHSWFLATPHPITLWMSSSKHVAPQNSTKLNDSYWYRPTPTSPSYPIHSSRTCRTTSRCSLPNSLKQHSWSTPISANRTAHVPHSNSSRRLERALSTTRMHAVATGSVCTTQPPTSQRANVPQDTVDSYAHSMLQHWPLLSRSQPLSYPRSKQLQSQVAM